MISFIISLFWNKCCFHIFIYTETLMIKYSRNKKLLYCNWKETMILHLLCKKKIILPENNLFNLLNIVLCHFSTSLSTQPYFPTLCFSFIWEAVTPWRWEPFLTSVILMSQASLNLFCSLSFYPSVLILISLLLLYVIYNFIDYFIILKQTLFPHISLQ